MDRVYIAIDLKSFFASVECVERNLDPMNTNLVVADNSRTNSTICLAITPSLKELGISARPRLFEVETKINEINRIKRNKLGYDFFDKSYLKNELSNPTTQIDYIVAKPRMQYYINYSTKIINVYTKYVSYDDIHIYSIDEVFIDATQYLKLYNMKAIDFVKMILKDILDTTGITATAGIGTNLYLAKVAMDILAKKKKKIRIAALDNMGYRKKLWNHQPLSDFWRIGKNTAQKLEKMNIYTMGDLARLSLSDEKSLYDEFGVNAELLIDHAWGYESCTIEAIKKYKPLNKSISMGQVLYKEYDYDNAKMILKEMVELLSLDLFRKKLLSNRITICLTYNDSNSGNRTIKMDSHTNMNTIIQESAILLYDRIVDRMKGIRKIYISLSNLIEDSGNMYIQQSLFDNNKNNNEKEKKLTSMIINIKDKFGKNSILKATNLEKDSTMKNRNNQIGGHQ